MKQCCHIFQIFFLHMIEIFFALNIAILVFCSYMIFEFRVKEIRNTILNSAFVNRYAAKCFFILKSTVDILFLKIFTDGRFFLRYEEKVRAKKNTFWYVVGNVRIHGENMDRQNFCFELVELWVAGGEIFWNISRQCSWRDGRLVGQEKRFVFGCRRYL